MKRVAVLLLLLPACSSSSSDPASDPPPSDPPAAPPPNAAPAPFATPVHVPLRGSAPFWLTDVTIGGQRFTLSLDTGSTTTVVAGAACSNCNGAHTYRTSPTAVDEKTPVSGVYDGGDMKWDGNVIEDGVAVGGSSPVRVRFGAISSQTNFISMMGTDGIIGLGPTRLAAPGTTSVLDALVKAGMPDVFAVKLCPGDAHLWLGGFDSTQSAPMQYAPLLPPTKQLPFYNVTVAGIAIDGKPLAVPDTTWGTSLIDTGGPAFFVPKDVMDALIATVSANGEFAKRVGDPTKFYASGACVASTATAAEIDAVLPPLTLSLGDGSQVKLDLPASQSYLVPSTEFGDANASGWCPGIVSVPGPPAFDIGSSILRSLVVVFDRANAKLGFAKHAGCK
jgi:hypothetical protein